MRQNSITKFYFAIIMALMLVSCSKDSEVLSTDNSILSLETAKSYFEKCFISESLTKSSEEFKISNRLFYTGDFTPQWDKTKYSKNSVLEGYDVEIFLPKYKYVVEREIYEKGSIKTFSVDVTQKLVVMREPETGRMSQYILTLIPDKQCFDIHGHKIKDNFSSFSDKNGFSGISIHTIPQLGIPVSVARYLNGRIISSVMMISDTEEGMVENARKAFSIIGTLTIRSKVRLMTKSGGCDSNGSYGEGETSTIPGFERLSNGLFWDGTYYWYDSDGDGLPDVCIYDSYLLDEIIVEGESGGGGGSPVNPGAGNSGGENEGGGSGVVGYDSGVSDEIAHETGFNAFCKVEYDIAIGNYVGYSVQTNSYSSTEISMIGAISNVEGLWTSWLPAIKNSPAVLKGFGSILSLSGIYDSAPDAVRTFMAVINGDVDNYSTQDILEMVSTALNTLGFIACCVPEPIMTKTIGATLSFTGCVVGLIAPLFNYSDFRNSIIKLPLDNGYLTLYIV